MLQNGWLTGFTCATFPTVHSAATRPLPGASAVARFAVGSHRFLADPFEAELTEINGEPAVILRNAGQPHVVVAFTLEHERIVETRAIHDRQSRQAAPSAITLSRSSASAAEVSSVRHWI
jgi:hypothetical protein